MGGHDVVARLADNALTLLDDETSAAESAGVAAERARLLLLRGGPGDAEQARSQLQARAAELARFSAHPLELASCLTDLARAGLATHRSAEARIDAQRAVDLLTDRPPSRTSAEALAVLAEAYATDGEREKAITALSAAADQLTLVAPPRQAAQAWYGVAEALRAAGAGDDSQAAAYRHALDAAGVHGTLAHLPRRGP
jgi:tetratricopeptide (TPR) repeat protein